MSERVGGIIQLKVDGELFQAKGEFTYNINPVKRETVVGVDGIHGFSELPKVQFIEGIITDSGSLDAQALLQIEDATVTLELANEKVISLREAIQVAEGDTTTNEGEIAVRFEGEGEEIR